MHGQLDSPVAGANGAAPTSTNPRADRIAERLHNQPRGFYGHLARRAGLTRSQVARVASLRSGTYEVLRKIEVALAAIESEEAAELAQAAKSGAAQ